MSETLRNIPAEDALGTRIRKTALNTVAGLGLLAGAGAVACGEDGGNSSEGINISGENQGQQENDAPQEEVDVLQGAQSYTLLLFINALDSKLFYNDLFGDPTQNYIDSRITEGKDNFPLNKIVSATPVEDGDDLIRIQYEQLNDLGVTRGEIEVKNFSTSVNPGILTEADIENGWELTGTTTVNYILRVRHTECPSPHEANGDWTEWRDGDWTLGLDRKNGEWNPPMEGLDADFNPLKFDIDC